MKCARRTRDATESDERKNVQAALSIRKNTRQKSERDCSRINGIIRRARDRRVYVDEYRCMLNMCVRMCAYELGYECASNGAMNKCVSFFGRGE